MKLRTFALAVLMAIATFSANAFWWPNEKYARFISVFEVDKTFTFENNGSDNNGKNYSGYSTQTTPGMIAMSFICWNNYKGGKNDYNLNWVTIELINKSTGKKLEVAHIDFTGEQGSNSWSKEYSEEANPKYYYANNDFNYYWVQKRTYRSHGDGGSMFHFFNMKYSEAAKEFIKAAGTNLQVHVTGNWDGRNINDKSDMPDFSSKFIDQLESPTVSEMEWEDYGSQTGVSYKRTTPASTQVRTENLNGSTVVSTTEWADAATSATLHTSWSTFPGANYQTGKLDATQCKVRVQARKYYGINQSYYRGAHGCPTEIWWYSSQVTQSAPTYKQPENLTVRDMGTGKIEVTWNIAPTTVEDVDLSDIVLQRSLKSDFTNAKTFELTYDKSAQSYKQEDEIVEFGKGKVTYYYRIYRKHSNPAYGPVCSMASIINTNYSSIQRLDAEDKDGKAQVSWVVNEGVWNENMQYRLSYTNGADQTFSRETTSTTIALPSCTPTTFTLAIVDGTKVIGETMSRDSFVISDTKKGVIEKLSVSKGYFNDKVQVRWWINQTNDNFSYYTVKRCDYNDGAREWVMLGTVKHTVGVYEYNLEDKQCTPGNYYVYLVEGYGVCDDKPNLKHSRSGVGFAQPYGVISGQITYSGNQGVKGVTVSVVGETARKNCALHFEKSKQHYAGLPASQARELFSQSGGAVELYFRALENTDNRIYSWKDNMGCHIKDGVMDAGLTVNIGGTTTWRSLSIKLDTVPEYDKNAFNHFVYTYSYNADSHLLIVEVYINGDLAGRQSWQEAKTTTLFANSTGNNAFLLGGIADKSSFFNGFMDEVRMWDVYRDSSSIAETMNRYLAGNETNLTAYYRCDDEITGELFDISKTDTKYNERHMVVEGVSIDASNVPTTDQISIRAVTDKDGNYLINTVPYTSDGSLYKVIPSLGVHEFAPSSRPLFFNTNTSTHNSIDFTDKSSFEVTGRVTFENTNFPVKGCTFYVDEQVCTKESKPVESDEEGNFTISVPIGSHHITVKKDGHTFADNGRYPADPNGIGVNHTFEEPMSNLLFYDNTTVLLTGRVAGGSDEANKLHGFALGRANIGRAKIVLCPPSDKYNLNLDTAKGRTFIVPDSVQCNSVTTTGRAYQNLAHSITILTDSFTGEFTAALPPIDFEIKSINLPKNEGISFNLSQYGNVQLGSKNIRQLTTDSLKVDSTHYRRFTYLYALDVIHYEEPVLYVMDKSHPLYAGEKEYYITGANAKTDTVPLISTNQGKISYLYGAPCFLQEKAYTWKMKAYETYINKDKAVPDTTILPMRKAILTITSEIGEKQIAQKDTLVVDTTRGDSMQFKAGDIINLSSNQLQLDNNGEADYRFVAGQPNVVAPYTLGLTIIYEDATRTRNYAWSENGNFKGIVLGALTSGTNFVTAGVDKPEFILRDPPGAMSTATWEKGEKIVSNNSYSHSVDRGGKATGLHHFGATFQAVEGIGFATITEVEGKNSLELGIDANGSTVWKHHSSYTETLNQAVSTQSDGVYVGSDGDIYIGNSTNILYGNARKLTFEQDSGKYKLVVKDVTAVGTQFKTVFNYSQRYVIDELIPHFEKLRNSLLTTVKPEEYDTSYVNKTDKPIYITTLKPGDFGYGTANHDSIWGSRRTRVDSTAGPSYIMIPPKQKMLANASDQPNIEPDEVNYYIQQIALWKNTIALNERTKAFVHGSSKKFDEKQWIEAKKKAETAKKWKKRLLDPNDYECEESGTYQTCSHDVLVQKWKSSGVDTAKCSPLDYYKGGWLLTNTSLDGGATVTTTSIKVSTDGEYHSETNAVKGVEASQTGVQVNGFGFFLKTEGYLGGTFIDDDDSEKTNSTTISYTLKGNDYEALSIDIYQDPYGFGPIFATRGGQTYCPYEGEERTQYYEPGQHILHDATVKMEDPDISVDKATIVDIPVGGKAVYTITLRNRADVSATSFTWMRFCMDESSNKNGAKLIVDGAPLTGYTREMKVYPNSPITKTLTLEQSRPDILNYDSIGIIFSNNCSPYSDADTVWISARFVQTCSPVELSATNLILNTTTGDTAQFTISAYDRTYANFQGIRLQYRSEADNNWHLVKEFVNADSLLTPEKELIKGATIHYSMPLKSPDYVDGNYLFRAVTVCKYGNSEINNESQELTITRDMSAPTNLSEPSPNNGILAPGSEVYVVFNENIQTGKVSPANVSVKGILNAHTVKHDVAVLLNETPIKGESEFNLSLRPFTIETWLRYSEPGVIFSHANGEMEIRILEDDYVQVKIDSTILRSAKPLVRDTWMFLAFAFDYTKDGGQLNARFAYNSTTTPLFDGSPIPFYGHRGLIAFGEGMHGAIHDVAFWSVAHEWDESALWMNTSKVYYLDHLMAYWEMAEGYGTKANDAVRSRDLLVPANSWYYSDSNFALSLDQTTATIPFASRSLDKDDDAAVEMWFRLEDEKATLLSWKGASLKADKHAFLLTMDSSKYSATFSDSECAIGEWHHLLLNIRRSGNTQLVLDGATLLQLPSSIVPALAGDLTLGDTTATMDLDEIRIWVTRSTCEWFGQYRHSRITGAEAGLRAYYPMEAYQSAQGQQTLVFSPKDATKDTIYQHPNLTGEHLVAATSTPALLASRPVETVEHKYTVSDKSIVINITEPAARIEGTTLEFEVKDIVDKNGNYSTPIRWTAYVNQNCLRWKESSFVASMAPLNEYYVEFEIVNNSGTAENWKITNIPSWLTLSETQGYLTPLSSTTVSGVISAGLSVGEYNTILYLTGNKDVRDPLYLTAHVMANRPDWDVNPADYEMSMNLIATVYLGNEIDDNSSDLIAAFIGDKCVGIASPTLLPTYGSYYVLMSIYGNDTDKNRDISFRLWDATSGQIYTNLTTSEKIVFGNGKMYGTLISPIILRTGTNLERTTELLENWNWISLGLIPTDAAPRQVLSSVFDDIIIVKGNNGYAQPSGDTLTGTLKQMRVQSMYKLKMKAYSEWTLTGTAPNALNTPIAIYKGWNWIGYLPQTTTTVAKALSYFEPTENDIVKSRDAFTVYDGKQWVGTLTAMTPGQGYLYYSNNTEKQSLYYPSLTLQPNAIIAAHTEDDNSIFNPTDGGYYAGNMTVTARVMNGNEIVANVQVAVYADEECRTAEQADASGLVFLTIPGDEEQALLFRVAVKDDIQEVDQHLTYEDDAIIGTPAAPYIIQLGEDTALDDVMGESDINDIEKFVIDGILYIRRGSHFYDATGREVANPRK